MESVGETCELEQLVPSDADADGENEDSIAPDDYNVNESKVVSPIRSNKVILTQIQISFENTSP